MEYLDSPEEAAFRANVKQFIRENLPAAFAAPEYIEHEFDAGMERGDPNIACWRAALASRNWIAPHWPKEYGGAGLTVGEQFVLNEELAEVRAPDVGMSGVNLIGPILMLHGSEKQKAEQLPLITSGERFWAQGHSEPGAGADLASLITRAVRSGDDFVVSGQKIWTSGAHKSDWIFLLARTDAEAPKHKGITMFLLDRYSPDITVRPIVNIAGYHSLNEVFFDDVRVPRENVVGTVDQGWYVGAALLDFERSDIRRTIVLGHMIRTYIAAAKTTVSGSHRLPTMRAELSERSIEALITRLLSYRIISTQKRGLVPNHEASAAKVFAPKHTSASPIQV
ncbi:MAG: acyl-CoA dehydrogenase family protein [Tepidiformaceae bacterium]